MFQLNNLFCVLLLATQVLSYHSQEPPTTNSNRFILQKYYLMSCSWCTRYQQTKLVRRSIYLRREILRIQGRPIGPRVTLRWWSREIYTIWPLPWNLLDNPNEHPLLELCAKLTPVFKHTSNIAELVLYIYTRSSRALCGNIQTRAHILRWLKWSCERIWLLIFMHATTISLCKPRDHASK